MLFLRLPNSPERNAWKPRIYRSSYTSESTSTLLQLELSECERDIRLRKLLWENLTDWKKYMSAWSSSSFHTIDVTEIQKIVKHMTQTIMLLEKGRSKYIWITERLS